MTTIGILAPGAMGSAVGARLAGTGATVLTSLAGRSEATIARARSAGLLDADDAAIVGAEIVLSIVPPSDALAVARRLADAAAKTGRHPLIVDCNAVNVETVREIEDVVSRSGARFVDGAIIGLPPVPGSAGPTFHVSGAHAPEVAQLRDLGLDLRMIDGPVGAASALKMCFAGVNKGLTALGAAMALAAARAGATGAMRGQLGESAPQILARLDRALPDMLPKAYRWVAEMREIAGFLGPDDPASLIFEGAARLFEHIERERKSEGADIERILAFAKAGR